MKAIAGLAAIAAALAMPAVASAKGLTTVRVCGAEDCVTLEDSEQAAQVISPQETVREPPKPASYYRLEIAVEAGNYSQSYSGLLVPAERLIATNAGDRRALLWYVPRTGALHQLGPATRDLTAFDPPNAWPLAVEDAAAGASGDSVGVLRWGIAGSALLVALTAAALALRIRIRKPETA